MLRTSSARFLDTTDRALADRKVGSACCALLMPISAWKEHHYPKQILSSMTEIVEYRLGCGLALPIPLNIRKLIHNTVDHIAVTTLFAVLEIR